MAIEVRCPECGEALTLANRADRAKRLRCPECDHTFRLAPAAPARVRRFPRWLPYAVGGVAAVAAVVLVAVFGSAARNPDPADPPVARGAEIPAPPRPPIPNTGDGRLVAITEYDRLAIPDTPLDPLVVLDDDSPYGPDRPSQGTGLLHRELYRQAVLIAARDELGLTTRDRALGESPPHDLPAGHRLQVTVDLIDVSRFRRVRIEAGAAPARRPVWEAQALVPKAVPEPVPTSLAVAEGFSRGGYVTALRRAGGWTPVAPRESAAPVPADIAAALGRMTVVSQTGAIRALHAAIRTDGESVALLGALSRGYANLGLLTDSLWDGSTWVFKARGLLYAERLRHRDAAAGLWHRAYALAVCSLHADALRDLDEAAKRPGAAPPAWAPLVRSLCRYDAADLTARAKTAAGLGQTALLFRFLAVEDHFYPDAGIEAGQELMALVPECHRVQDSLARLGGVSAQHRTTVSGLATLGSAYGKQLAKRPDLPDAVKGAIGNEAAASELADALTAAGRDGADRHELSWAVLGHLARESWFTLVDARLAFLRYVLGVPVDEFLADVRPTVADHPLYPLLETYAVDPARQPQRQRDLLLRAPVRHLTLRQRPIIWCYRTLTDNEGGRALALCAAHGDRLASHLSQEVNVLRLDPDVVPRAKELLAVSPYSPDARKTLIAADWAAAAPHAARWEADSQSPAVFRAFAEHALRSNDIPAAERYLTRFVALSPTTAAFAELARVYQSLGRADKWLETLEEALDRPDTGLGHARIRTTLAQHHLKAKDYKTARKFAERAAETRAEWAMLCAAECAELDGDVDAAGVWMRRVSERYEHGVTAWYYWCLRTGRGDVATARRLVEDHLERVGRPRTVDDLSAAAVLHLAAGRRRKAIPILEQAFAVSKFELFLLIAAAEADAAGDAAERDRLFKACPATGAYAPVAKFLRDSLAADGTAVPDPKRFDAACRPLTGSQQRDVCYVYGRIARTRGAAAIATRGFTHANIVTNHEALSPILSAMALREK